MNEQPLLFSIEILVGSLAIISTVIIILASLYDFRAVSRRAFVQATARRLRSPNQPLVTVLIYAKNQAHTIEVCLASVARSTYHNVAIIVIDNCSRDGTSRIVRRYHRLHPHMPLTLYTKRKSTDYETALQQGYKKTHYSDFVLTLSASSSIAPNTIKQAVARLISQPRLDALQLSHQAAFVPSMAHLATTFLQLSSVLWLKSRALLPLPLYSPRDGTLYAATVFKELRARQSYRLGYASTCMITTGSRLMHTMRPEAIIWHSFSALIIFCVVGYSLYAAATFASSTLLLFSWLLVSLWLFVAVWSSETHSTSDKLRLSYGIPSGYLLTLFYGAVLLHRQPRASKPRAVF